LIMVFLYMTLFSYMYYTSPEWSYVGCLIAGFGCYGLVGYNVKHAGVIDFATRYEEIGMVTAAIVIQIIVDTVDTAVRKQFPRDVITRNIAKLGMQSQGGSPGLVVQVFNSFFKSPEPDFEAMKGYIQEAKDLMAQQKAMLSECQDKTIVTRGLQVPFKYELCCQALVQIRKILDDVEVLVLLHECGVFREEEDVDWNEVFGHWRAELRQVLVLAFRALQHALEQRQDEQISIKIKDLKLKSDAVTSSKFVRVTVAKKVLHDIMSHAFELEHLCYSSGCFN